MHSATPDMVNQTAQAQPARKKNKALTEAALVVVLCAIVYFLAGRVDLLERFYDFSRIHDGWELDEFAAVGIFLMFYFVFLAMRKWRQAAKANQELRRMNQALKEAAEEIQQLQGIIPICARCKNIRDDEGYWQKVEEYIRSRANVRFTHGLCPECFKILYPEVNLPDEFAEKQKDSEELSQSKGQA
jgi:preprotein translocase subunit YajC